MAIVFTYDLESASIKDANDRTRIDHAFQRFGWEHIGGSAYRYPPLAAGPSTADDWFNSVVPALAFFRALVLKKKLVVTRYVLEAHSSSGSGPAGAAISPAASLAGAAPVGQDGLPLTTGEERILSAARLRKWVKATENESP